MSRTNKEQGMHTVWIDTPGGSEVLSCREGTQPQPKDGEVLVKLAVIGVNFDGVYYRSALYVTSYPFIPGMEAAEEVEAMGERATDLKRGDRVVYASSRPGSDAEYAGEPASIVVPVPDDIEDRSSATAVLLICASGRLSLIGPTLAVDVKRSFARDNHDTTSHY